MIVAGSFLTTPLGLINSPRLLEHQVTANRGPDAASGPHCADFATVPVQDLWGTQLGLKKKSKSKSRTVLETLHLHLPCTLSPNLLLAQQKKHGMRYCFFFKIFFLLDTIMFARQKPLETVIKSGPSYFSTKKPLQLKSLVQHFHYPLSPSLPSRLLTHRRCPPPTPMLPSSAHVFIFSSPPAALLL